MTEEPDVMRLLAAGRPAVFDEAPDQRRREIDLNRTRFELGGRSIQRTASRRPFFGRPPSTLRAGQHRTAASRLAMVLATAAAAVAAVAVVATGSLQRSSLPTAGDATAAARASGKTEASAEQLLLLAANQTHPGADSGRYWRTTTELMGLDVAGPADAPYGVRTGDRDQIWAARDASNTSWFVDQRMSVDFATAADREAWQQDGSPTVLTIREAWDDDHPTSPMPVGAGKPAVGPVNADSEIFSIGGRDVSMRTVRKLPSDQASLRTVLLSNYQRDLDPVKSQHDVNGVAWSKDQWLFSSAADVLTLPVTPAVRASCYRILAGLADVHSLGTVADTNGRRGNAVAIQLSGPQGLSEDRLIIDAVTGMLLSEEIRILKPSAATAWMRLKPTDVWRATIVTDNGWTNDRPPARTS